MCRAEALVLLERLQHNVDLQGTPTGLNGNPFQALNGPMHIGFSLEFLDDDELFDLKTVRGLQAVLSSFLVQAFHSGRLLNVLARVNTCTSGSLYVL